MTSAGLSGGVPGGTIASLISACEDVPFNHLVLSSCDWSLSPVPGARSPGTSLVYRLGPGSRFVGGIGFFNTVNRALVQRTAGLREYAHKEAQLGGRGGRGAGASYGPAFTYTEFTPTGNTVVAFMLSLALGIGFASLTFLAPVRVVFRSIPPIHTVLTFTTFWCLFTGSVVGQASGDAARLWASRPVRTGHFSVVTEAKMRTRFASTLESGGMKYVNVTASDEPSPRYAKTVIKGRGDPGTLLTAVMVVESALTLLLDELPPLAATGGVLTPMTALGDSLIHRLRANERFEIETALVDSPDDEISEDKKTR